MQLEVQLVCGLTIALVVAYSATPVAIRVAHRLEFFDKPFGYKGHARPTPYLGGAAVVAAFVVASLVMAGNLDRTVPIVAGALILWAVGTLDDRHNLSPYLRLAVEFAVAAGLWALGLGWNLGFGGFVDLVVTCLWVAGVVNAFNLFDNMDGAASTMAAVVAGGVAVLGAVLGEVWLAVVGAALCGACLGFLPHNLAKPARIFLGDGGSMPVGFIAASLVMIGASDAVREWQALAIALLLVGVPLLDTVLVVISRRRRGIPILTGGRDHLTHRTRERIRNVRAVAVALGGAQAMLAAFALLAYRGGSIVLVIAVALYVLAAATAIEFLDGEYGADERDAAESRGWRPRPVKVVIAGIGLALGLSPFYEGGYDASLWAPAGVVLLAMLAAAAIAQFPRLNALTLTAVGSLGGLAVWSLISGWWSSSPFDAGVFGNRLVVYTVLLGLLVLLIRDLRTALWALGSVTAGTLAVALWTVGTMLFGDGPGLFAAGRLNEPLGYINAQGAVYAMAFVPCLLLAEWRRPVWAAAPAAGVAAMLAGLVILSQSRGAWLGLVIAVAVVLAMAPGRLWRIAAVGVIAASVAPMLPWLDDVYTEGSSSAVVEDMSANRAAIMLIAGSILASLLWMGAIVAARHVAPDRRREIARWVARALTAATAIAAVAAVVASPRLVDEVNRQYDSFINLGVGGSQQAGSSRVLSGSGVRYDYWRIAVRAWKTNPLVGVGAGGYAVPYYQQRETTEDVRQPHSLELQVLSELGLLGLAFLAVWLAALALAAVRSTRRSVSTVDRFLTAAGAGMFVTWLMQTSGDWLHLLPGVTGVALVGAAVILRPVKAGATATVAPRRTRGFRAWALAGAVVAVAGLVLLSRLALVEHYRSEAQSALAAQDPDEALRLANRSLRLEDYDVNALYLRSAALERLDRRDEARAVLEDALRVEPDNFVTWALMGDLEARAGDDRAALRAYRRASALNPRDPGLAEAAGWEPS